MDNVQQAFSALEVPHLPVKSTGIGVDLVLPIGYGFLVLDLEESKRHPWQVDACCVTARVTRHRTLARL